jgi:hypothetical protein
MELSIELYINKLSYDSNYSKALHYYYLLDLKALKLRLQAKDNVALVQLTQRYKSLISKLLYLASQLRIDIAFVVSYLARAISNLTKLYY